MWNMENIIGWHLLLFSNFFRLTQQEMSNKHWNYIVKYCKLKKQCYLDDDFPPMPSSLYYNPNEMKDTHVVKWKRLRDIVVDEDQDTPWAIFRKPQPSDISQGKKHNFCTYNLMF